MRGDRAAAVLLSVVVLCACGGEEAEDAPRDARGAGGGQASTAATPTPLPPPRATPTPAGSPALAQGCPADVPLRDGQAVAPAPPTTETEGRLVPDADPVEALVCRYSEDGSLAGAVLLEDGLDGIRLDLQPSAVPSGLATCPPPAGAGVHHLARFRYADGELWLAATQVPGGCSTSGNGAFVTSTYLGDRLARAFDSRAWPEE